MGSGTGLHTTRYWSGFLIDSDILLDAPPTVGIHLRKVGAKAEDVNFVFVSHLHADHTFGLVFLFLEFRFAMLRKEPLTIVGPPGIQDYLENLYGLAYPYEVAEPAGAFPLPLRFDEVGASAARDFGNLSYEAVPMAHHADSMRSFGYRLRRGDCTIAYSGDTRMCQQLVELATGASVFIVECTNERGAGGDHLSLDDIRCLREIVPTSTRIVVTHTEGIMKHQLPPGTVLVEDFDSLTL